ncbi:hypothetical protein ACQP2T_02805 [Nonomuraea sp. CA-143628]|uniref:hypothetical protein n=1 Tax=Nonomuraea sp. CA-143628 TaxID=3239997 RepID=UPI003D9115DE
MISVRFLKPLTVTLASAALVALPFAGGAFADSGQPQPAPTVTPGVKTTQKVTPGVKTTPTTKPTAPVKTGRPTATDENARPKRPTSTAHERETTTSTLYLKERRTSLDVSVNPTRVKQGASYGVTIVVKGASAGKAATITSPEGKSYRVSLDQRTVTKTLTVPAKAKLGAKTVTVKVGNRTATAQFTVVRGGDHRDDRRHEGK